MQRARGLRSMAPPLIQLKDIALTFGGTPLLTGVELQPVGRRARLPGRPQRLRQIDAAEDRRRAGRAGPRHALHRSPARPCATCRRSRISAPRTTTLAYVEAGLGPGDDRHHGALSARAAWPHRRRRPRASLRRRGAARGAGAGAGALARHPAARRADQPSRSSDHRMARAASSPAAAPRW